MRTIVCALLKSSEKKSAFFNADKGKHRVKRFHAEPISASQSTRTWVAVAIFCADIVCPAIDKLCIQELQDDFTMLSFLTRCNTQQRG